MSAFTGVMNGYIFHIDAHACTFLMLYAHMKLIAYRKNRSMLAKVCKKRTGNTVKQAQDGSKRECMTFLFNSSQGIKPAYIAGFYCNGA